MGNLEPHSIALNLGFQANHTPHPSDQRVAGHPPQLLTAFPPKRETILTPLNARYKVAGGRKC